LPLSNWAFAIISLPSYLQCLPLRGDYLFTERIPLPDEIVAMLEVKPKILERKTIVERATAKIVKFVETFINGMGELNATKV
jgi:hypothetical protein